MSARLTRRHTEPAVVARPSWDSDCVSCCGETAQHAPANCGTVDGAATAETGRCAQCRLTMVTPAENDGRQTVLLMVAEKDGVNKGREAMKGASLAPQSGAKCCDPAARSGVRVVCSRTARAAVPGWIRSGRSTLTQHYYPEGGWAWLVMVCAAAAHALTYGVQLAGEQLLLTAAGVEDGAAVRSDVSSYSPQTGGWLMSCSLATSLLVSPLTVAVCRHRSTRVTAVLGGLVTALGCLFTSFANRQLQLAVSYCLVLGVGSAMVRDSSTLMVAQYYKRRREMVETVVVAAGGAGIALMTYIFHIAVSSLGWRLGLQAVTGLLLSTFFLSMCYRSASLYHPQRRAILHLKQQKKKIKDKKTVNTKIDPKRAFFDCSTLKSRTVQIILVAVGCVSLGIYTPLFLLHSLSVRLPVSSDRTVLLHATVGLGWCGGCCLAGGILAKIGQENRSIRQYLCQVALLTTSLATLLFANVTSLASLTAVCCLYGLGCGMYHYTLKIFIYEKVRARNFANTWSFAQCCQAPFVAFGTPAADYLNGSDSAMNGFAMAAAAIFVGGVTLFLVDIHRNRRRRQHQQLQQLQQLQQQQQLRHTRQLTTDLAKDTAPLKRRRFSLPEEDVPLPSGVNLEPEQLLQLLEAAAAARRVHRQLSCRTASVSSARDRSATAAAAVEGSAAGGSCSCWDSCGHDSVRFIPNDNGNNMENNENNRNSDGRQHYHQLQEDGEEQGGEGDEEEVDIDDITERLLRELEHLYCEDITICNQVENCVMLSEFEHNLIGQTASAAPAAATTATATTTSAASAATTATAAAALVAATTTAMAATTVQNIVSSNSTTSKNNNSNSKSSSNNNSTARISRGLVRS